MTEIVVEENIPGCIKDCSECWYFNLRSGTCEAGGQRLTIDCY
ncbi:MAG: hypothetical protein ACYSR9_00245 [Planctomycetota bacterium]